MPNLFTVFRVVAIAEACSWLGLLIGMFFKYIVVGDDIGVKVFGPIHGALFVAYVFCVLAVAARRSWSWRTTALGVASGIPPFTSIWFERRAASIDTPTDRPTREPVTS